MKTPEDEAFDELARKQGAWGGGFQAKRQMAMDKINADFREEYIKYRTAFPKEYTAPQPVQEPVNLLEARKIAAEYGMPDLQIDSGNLYFALSKCLEHIDAQPAQDGKCKCVCHDGCAACKQMAQPAQEPVAHLWVCLGRWSAYLVENGKQADCAPPSWLVDAINKATTSPLPVQEPIGSLSVRYFRGSKAMTNTDFDYTGDLPEGDYELYTAPPQRTWIWLSDADIAEVVDTTCQYTGSYEEFLIKKAERKIRSMNHGT